MRLYFTSNLTFSEDDATSPNNIIYQDANRSITDTSLPEGTSGFQSFAPSATDITIPMGNITVGKWLYLYADASIEVKIDGAAVGLTLAASRPHQLWVDFASLTVTNPSAVQSVNISWALGGD